MDSASERVVGLRFLAFPVFAKYFEICLCRLSWGSRLCPNIGCIERSIMEHIRLSRRQFLLGMPLAATALVLGRSGFARSAVPAIAQSTPFQAGSDGYTCFRTPALAITAAGVVLAFSGGRLENCKDDGDHDLVLRRSFDGGLTWGPLQVLVNNGKNRCDIPVPVVLTGGRVLLLWVWNPFVALKEDRGERRVMVCHSDDDGNTWSASRDITPQVRLAGWTPWYGIGPGHGFVKQLAPAAGRIVVPARHGEAAGSRSHLIISDDGGITWQVGAQAQGPRNSSESTAAELGDGSILLNSRTKLGYRLITLCKDGGMTTVNTQPNFQLVEPKNGCQASLLTYSLNSASKTSILLFSNPNHLTLRTNGRIRLSRDGGKSWSSGYSYQQGVGAFTGYSDLARYPNGDVALAFESGVGYHEENETGKISKKGQPKKKRLLGRYSGLNNSQSQAPRKQYDEIIYMRIPFAIIEKSS